MKASLLGILIAILFIGTGCSFNDKDPEPEKTYLLQRKYSEIVSHDLKGSIDLTYTYNDNDQLVNISGVTDWKGEIKTSFTTLTYDNKGRVERINTLSGNEVVHFYDDKDRLIKLTKAYKDSKPVIFMHYYDNEGRLIEIKAYSGEITEENSGSRRLITYVNENQIKVTVNTVTGATRNYTLITDSKKRELPVLAHQISAGFFAAELMSESLITKNNILSNELIHTNINDASVNNKAGVSYQSEYTYNDGGYPTSCIKVFHEGSIENITYTYSVK
ncbi:hypothetical protein I0P70_11030 [Pontibacter sp. FD36]|uniref:hypothetical protein n=1 Tax=Pontibacter sp. FD36 TaxID=2789860 RepID=UPI0018A8F613|nr:hypothetical protein [Pontibacter sp. FD36]MBF8963784.1 hypothetical protein [Pontibacter sp. FD36]